MKALMILACFALVAGVAGCGSTGTRGVDCYQDKVRDFARSVASGGGDTGDGRFVSVRLELARTGWVEAGFSGDFSSEQLLGPSPTATVCPSSASGGNGQILIKGYEGDYLKLR